MLNTGIRRAVDPPVEWGRLGQTPLVTALAQGQPRTRFYPGTRILKPFTSPNIEFSYPVFGKERLKNFNTKRAPRAKIMRGTFQVTTASAKTQRYSFATDADQIELSNAHPSLQFRARKAAFAREVVELDMERDIASILTTTTTYPVAHRLAIGAGSEWDSAGGDSLTDVVGVMDAICTSTGLQRSDLSVFLPKASMNAALMDPLFRQARLYTSGEAMAGLGALAAYWGCREVFTANVIVSSDANVISELYGDIAIIYYDGGAVEYDTEWGDLMFGRTVKLGQGSALEAWYDNDTTTWVFPWEDWSAPVITNSYCAGIITNCAA